MMLKQEIHFTLYSQVEARVMDTLTNVLLLYWIPQVFLLANNNK